MRSKENPSVKKAVELTTRREVLLRGTAIAALSAFAPIWTRSAKAQSASSTFDYYISPTGSDSNPGTLASPWSLNALNSKGSVYAGKRVGIIGDQGTYNCYDIYIANNGGSTLSKTSTSAVNQAAFAVANGTASSPTYVGSSDSSGNYVARLAVLDGGATSLTQAVTINPGQNALIGALGTGSSPTAAYITVDGLVFQNNFSAYVYFGADATVSPSTRAPGITVKNCHFTGILYNQSGGAYSSNNPSFLTLWCCQGALIQNNLFDGKIDDAQDRATVFEQWGCLGTIAEYNTIIMYTGASAGNGAMFAKNINNTQLTYRYNYCYMPNNTSGLGNGWDLYGTSSNTSYFHNNIIVANNDAWYSPGGGLNNGAEPERKIIYNNTFIALGGNWASEGLLQLGAAGSVKSYNNILDRSGSVGYLGDYSSNADAFSQTDYNLFPASPRLGLSPPGSDPGSMTIYSSLSAWAAALPAGCVGKDAHSILGAPTYVSGSPTYPADAYKLAAGSLGIGAGRSGGTTSGTAVDMGAWGGTDVNTGQPIAQIGCNFVAGSTTGTLPAPPRPPVLSVS